MGTATPPEVRYSPSMAAKVRDVFCPDESVTRRVGAELSRALQPGDVVLLEGPLGAGKTTFVRGVLEGLGHTGPVRSPTFNLLQVFDTDPPVLHVDLYRLPSAQGIGLEDYLESHVCLVEWPERAPGFFAALTTIRIFIEFEGAGRRVRIVEG